jgi:hypothetical protein
LKVSTFSKFSQICKVSNIFNISKVSKFSVVSKAFPHNTAAAALQQKPTDSMSLTHPMDSMNSMDSMESMESVDSVESIDAMKSRGFIFLVSLCFDIPSYIFLFFFIIVLEIHWNEYAK